MGRLSGFQQSLIAVCALGLTAGSTLARIPHQDKPTAGKTLDPPVDAGKTATPVKKDPTPPPVTTQPAQPPVTVVVQQPAAPQQDASSGWIGILIAVALGYAGFRFAQNKGFTVVGMLTKAGVTLPKDPDPVPQGSEASALPSRSRTERSRASSIHVEL